MYVSRGENGKVHNKQWGYINKYITQKDMFIVEIRLNQVSFQASTNNTFWKI